MQHQNQTKNINQLKLTIMTTKKANNIDVITAKALATIKKDINAYRDSFKNAVKMMLEVSTDNKECKRVCSYLGITSESIKPKNISELRKKRA